jgi:NAD-dependent dihydropyrimidine dehydrogenase PreA subunit
MIREIVTIDENVCNGCGECIPNCHEGALQMIDGKARLISDLLCDGLGACIGHCPVGAITIEEREAEPYDETKAIQLMIEKGKNTVIAHLTHLLDHNETDFLNEGIAYLHANKNSIDFNIDDVIAQLEQPTHTKQQNSTAMHNSHGGCPGSQTMNFSSGNISLDEHVSGKSQLQQWPVQLHLVNPQASYFNNADVLLAADCVAFSVGNFHDTHLQGKSLAIACPKLDHSNESYIDKLTAMIDNGNINTLQVMIMEVPCCGGLLQIAQQAVNRASRKVPIKATVVGVRGDILEEKWI